MHVFNRCFFVTPLSMTDICKTIIVLTIYYTWESGPVCWWAEGQIYDMIIGVHHLLILVLSFVVPPINVSLFPLLVLSSSLSSSCVRHKEVCEGRGIEETHLRGCEWEALSSEHLRWRQFLMKPAQPDHSWFCFQYADVNRSLASFDDSGFGFAHSFHCQHSGVVTSSNSTEVASISLQINSLTGIHIL